MKFLDVHNIYFELIEELLRESNAEKSIQSENKESKNIIIEKSKDSKKPIVEKSDEGNKDTKQAYLSLIIKALKNEDVESFERYSFHFSKLLQEEQEQPVDENSKKDSKLFFIYNYYKIICDTIDKLDLRKKNLGMYLALKAFFERDLRDTNIFEGYEVMGETCEKTLYQTLEALYEINSQEVGLEYELQTPVYPYATNSELSTIYYMLEINSESCFDEISSEKNLRFFSEELQLIVRSFSIISQSYIHEDFLNKEYDEQLKGQDMMVIPYCQVDDLFIQKYNKVSEEYRALFHKLCECQLKRDLKVDNIHLNLLINKDNVLVYIIEKTKEKIKK